MSTPILFRISQEAQRPFPKSTSPAPMHVTLNEKVDEYAERLFTNYTAEENAIHLRELPHSEPIRTRLIQRYKEQGLSKAAFEVAIETRDLSDRKAQLETFISGFVKEDAFLDINRLVEAVVLERRDAVKYKVGLAYAETGNFLRAIEIYFYIERTEWRNRFFLAVMKYVPEENKGHFFTQILIILLNKNEVENAVDAIKKYPRINSSALFRDIANYLLQVPRLDKLCVVLNELERPLRAQYLENILTPLLINGSLEFVLQILEPLKENTRDPNFYDEVLFNMGKFLIANRMLSQIHLIKNSLRLYQIEFEALIPLQPMHD